MSLTRRGVLLTGVGALLGGCTAQQSSTAAPAGGAPTSDPSSGPNPTSRSSAPPGAPVLPAVTAWTPGLGELVPACKLAAVRRIERDGNDRDSALQVVDAQYGGLLTDTASVLVVTRRWRRRTNRITPEGRTYDVRLRRVGASWRVTAVHPSHPGPAVHRPSPAAREVLRSDRIVLPPAARRDVASGRVHESVLLALLTVSRSHRPSVSVLSSGHPLYVFGTDRLSDHPRGRAFDTWAIDGRAVVDPRTPRSLVEDYMHAVAAAGSYNVGGPVLLGSAPQWFSDDTHHDHVHAGFAA